MPFETLATLVHDRADASPSDVALRHREGGAWTDVTWAQLRTRVEHIAAGLLTGPAPLRPGDRVGIVAETSAAWIACDFAALSVAAQTVPIYTSLPAPEIGYAHVDTAIRVLIVGDAALYRKAVSVREGFRFFDRDYDPSELVLEHVVVIDPTGLEPGDDWESLSALEERGRAYLESVGAELATRRTSVSAGDLATFTYTSGTTGPPKAVTQTSANHLAIVSGTAEVGILSDAMREAGLFLFLPLAHSFGRLVQFAAPVHDLPLVLSSVPTVVADLVETRPGFVPAAPRVYEKLRAGVLRRIEGSPGPRRALAVWALGVGEEVAATRLEGGTPSVSARLRWAVADRLVLARIRAGLGLDRAGALLSGSAPLQPSVLLFLYALGLQVYEAYGLTETCPGLTANRPGRVRLGTVGQALPGVELRIAADGEILARGRNITAGYHNREEETRAAIDADGWFHTGDLGSLDDEGFLTITGRKKELIKTSGGKYVAPTKIEGALKLSPLVSEAVVVGDGRPYCVALLALDPDAVADHLARAEESAREGAVAAALDAHVRTTNADLAPFETVKYWRIIDAPTVGSGELTASLKVRRTKVEERWAEQVEDMYATVRQA
ncbi:AMP-dependent synthetase/ligase [Pseudonocardia humida]|uniref:Long-chain fatty acid--CoA ligase n=1 Tax=Pseudonocardia humida TaxID=2800819 RepID=A0ABT1A016_9PSEU|nr:long-chain fatty acid--CoA ligase [Pseudonocardia humida]MCO1656347.1 long-chain fatty acid--CoA ligase [Pseudonocardia humida]